MGPFGSDIKVENFVNDGVPVLNGSNLTGFKLVEDGFKYVTPEKAKTFKKAIARRGDIVITHRGTLGQISFIPDNSKFEEYVISQSQFRVELNRKIVDPAFFVYFFHTSEGQKRLLANKCHVGVPALAQATTNFKLVEIPLPNINTQQKIASILSALDAKIELNNRINAELEAMAKTLYDYWFVQFDFPDEEGKPYKTSGGLMVWNEQLKRNIPEGWEVKKLSEIATTGSGGTPLSTKKEFYENGNIPWINSGEVNMPFIVSTKNYITQKGLENSSAKMFKRGTILMAMYGATAGKVSFMNIEACTNQAICAINPKEDFYRIYIKHVLEDLYKYLINLSTGSARDNLSQDKIRELKFIIPSKSLIQKFDEMVQSSMDKILINLKENQHLASLRDWLLPMLMNGQITVCEAGKEIENNEKPIINLSEQQDQRFELWLNKRGIAARGEIDTKTLRDIFDAMDDEDK